jgi:hypothetical protein
VDEGGRSRQADEKNVKFCDLLEVYNSMERDILRRTHNIFSSLKDESGNKYDNANTNVTFVDENTLKYQNVIKKMDGKGGSGSGSGGSDDGDEEEFKEQSVVITTNVKHVGKGVIVQSYDISDDDDEGENDDDGDDNNDKDDKKVTVLYTAPSVANKNRNKNVEYTIENNIDVDDI